MNKVAELRVLTLAMILGTLGCSGLPGKGDSHERTGPKVLLEWSDNERDREAKKSEPEGAEAEEKAKTEEPDEIVTDRPDFTEASSTVGKGRFQLEMGYTFTRDRSNGERFRAHSYPEALFRIGTLAEWFELRIGQNFADERTTMPDGTRLSAAGANDLYLGVKLGLTEQKRWRPEVALILQTTVPTGAEKLTVDELLPGINLLYGWDVIEDFLSVGGSTQANRVKGEFTLPSFMGVDQGMRIDPSAVGMHSYLELAQSLTVNYALTKKLGAYTEWFAFFPHSALGEDVGPEHFLDGGFSYKITPLFQIDIRAGFGLNRRAADFFAGSGLAVKF